MYYMYILTRDKKPYIGYTNDLAKRFKQHSREYECALVYYEAYSSEKMAREREIKLKQYGSAWLGLKGRIFSKRGLGNDFKVAPAR